MKPFDTIIPDRPVRVVGAETLTKDDRHQLRFMLVANGVRENHVVVGDSILQLVARLCTGFGFTVADARLIVANAAQRDPAMN